MENCPCGSGKSYETCCEPVIKGTCSAETAEQLMRARYSAHVKVEADFLFESTHPDHRRGYDHQGTRRWAAESNWYGLEILGCEAGTAGDERGTVEFVARFRDRSGVRSHHERGGFQKYRGEWRFTEGEMVKAPPLISTKVGRNDPCSCGSGKKYKKCCGAA